MITLPLVYLLSGLATAIPEPTSQQHIRRTDSTTLDSSPKRGLLHITNPSYHPGIKPEQDLSVWTRSGSTLTWYYNYMLTPSIPSAPYEFVPMAWGPDDLPRLSTSLSALQSKGIQTSRLLFLNEPDGPKSEGGCDTTPSEAARLWTQHVEPLRAAHYLSLGAPATRGNPDGIKWLSEFLARCSGCSVDFIPFHWYGEAGQLREHVAAIRGSFKQKLWVTEYAPPPYLKKREQQEDWVVNVTRWMDGEQAVERYSYWGAWRRGQTPRGWGQGMSLLSEEGRVTDLGGGYLHLRVESAAAGRERGVWVVVWLAGWLLGSWMMGF